MKRELLSTVLARNLRQNQTDVERLLWFHLRNRQMAGVKFRRQQPIGSYIVDFVSFERKIVIELDGGYHNDEAQKIKDDERSAWLRSIGYNILRFWNNEIMENIEGVLENISLAITSHPGTLQSSGEVLVDKLKPRKFGLWKGKVFIPDDFDDEDQEINKMFYGE